MVEDMVLYKVIRPQFTADAPLGTADAQASAEATKAGCGPYLGRERVDFGIGRNVLRGTARWSPFEPSHRRFTIDRRHEGVPAEHAGRGIAAAIDANQLSGMLGLTGVEVERWRADVLVLAMVMAIGSLVM